MAMTLLAFLAHTPTTMAATIEQDLTTICGRYETLARDEKFRDFTTENKFSFVFNEKFQQDITNMNMRMFYSALRTTESKQRFDLMKAYAEGTLGKNWECPPMKEIMREFNGIDPLVQYAR